MPRNLTHRSYDAEILDGPGIPEDVRRRCYRDLALTHRWLRNGSAAYTEALCEWE